MDVAAGTRELTSELDQRVDDLLADGYCRFNRLLTTQALQKLRAVVEEAVAGRAGLPADAIGMEFGPGAEGSARKLMDLALHDTWVLELAAHPTIVAFASRVLGGGSVRLNTSTVWLKPARVGGPKPLHQDAPHWSHVDPPTYLTCWIAIDDADESNGCMRFVPGSHKGGSLPHRTGVGGQLVVEDGDAQLRAAVPVPVPAGGCSFHLGTTLHGSTANPTGRPRRALSLSYFSGSARVAAWAEQQYSFPTVTSL